ncbi:MAG: ABC transporter permease [Hyphomicrobiaceae bacterium]|nr:ABC transporter permease [Hyphomicrobiaceae bacterium]
MKRLAFGNTSLLFLLSALACLTVADIAVTALNPWGEMLRLLRGVLRPDFLSVEAWSVVWTVAFAVVGVAIGATAGLPLAILFPRFAGVRLAAVVLRSIHELFWALMLIQVFGLGPATGVLAIAIPYAGIFAKVFAEIIEEADLAAERVLPAGTTAVSAFAFARLPEVAGRFKTYTLYRLECGLRSTLVLGFIGLPTVGFHLEGYFKQGRYAEAAALLAVFYVLIGTRRLWARPTTVPILLVASLLLLPEAVGGGSALANLVRFITHDIVPAPLRGGDLGSLATWGAFAGWLQPIAWNQVLPGAWNTLVLAQIALVGMGTLALLLFPLVSRRFMGRVGQPAGRLLLVVMRSTPEYMLAYVLLQLLGPSMLPAILALTVHNGAIVGYLMGRHADALDYRADAPKGLNLYAYDTTPRLYGQFLAYNLYRWEIIVRESAIFGILGVATLGYHVDAAISELRFDVAVVLILATVAVCALIDILSRRLRKALRLSTLATRLADAPA